MKLRKKESGAILRSLASGVVPRVGLEHIVVGRRREMEQIESELQDVKQGSAIVKFFIGEFGSGKSFILSLIRHIAFKEKFVVADVDFSPEHRLYGSGGKSGATYSELMKNLATATRPKDALPVILDKWINEIQLEVVREKGFDGVQFDDPNFIRDVQDKMNLVLSQMEELVGGFDFAQVINRYYLGYVQDNREWMSRAFRWLRGEYTTRQEAHRDLGVRTIIDDHNWYDYLKVIARFITEVGYSGFVVNLDEAINLFKITHSTSRDKNYETILKIFNDAYQGKAEHLYITFAGTREFLEDERRGLFSYAALKTRLSSNRFETDQFRDLSQPVIRLTPLNEEEVFELLQKIRAIHAFHYGYEPTVTDQHLRTFLESMYARPGARERLTPRDFVRDFISILNLLHQNPEMDLGSLFRELKETDSEGDLAPVLDRFQKTRQ